MKYKDYRDFIKLVLDFSMMNPYIKDWYEAIEINVNDGYILFKMENYDNIIKLEIPAMENDKSFYTEKLANQWSQDVETQLLDVLNHYQKATLKMHEKSPDELIQ